MKYQAINALLILSLITGCKSPEEKLGTSMQKSITWLWNQQNEDGGWHSRTHAVLKDGKALTPYILYHLLLIPEDKFNKPEEAVDRGVEFIRREISASISMSIDSQQLLNYPNYSAAYALRVLCLLKIDTVLQRIIADHLLQEQFVEHRGIRPDNLAYGGWGYGEPDLPYGEHGHVDISHTRRILESLITYIDSKTNTVSASLRGNKSINGERAVLRPAKSHPCATAQQPHQNGGTAERGNIQYPVEMEKVIHAVSLFLQGVQRSPGDPRLYEGCISRKNLPYDGGFISSAVTLSTNKSQPIFLDQVGYYYPSYATATCDGLLALHALGKSEAQAFKDASHWLSVNQHMNTIDGLSQDDPEQWYQVMHYYHLAVRAEAMTFAGIEGMWNRDLAKILIREQSPEGLYINPIGGVNKEDDPLMATIFAIQAGLMIMKK